MKDDGANRTEPATAKKRQKARDEGQVKKSMEVITCVMMLASLFYLFYLGPWTWDQLKYLTTLYLSSSGQFFINHDNVFFFFTGVLKRVMVVLSPFLGMMLVFGFFSNYFQVGWDPRLKPIIPNFSKIIPNISALRNMFFSLNSLMELFKSTLKMVIIGGICYIVLKGEMDNLFDLPARTISYSFSFAAMVVVKMFFKVILIYIVLALLDYLFKSYQYEENLKMTKQEVEDENKQSQGDPKVKGAIRKKQREVAKRRFKQVIPEADVVVTNPTHFAVALRYKVGLDNSPRVLAKGKNDMAKKVKDIARHHNIPIIENRPLARQLYKTVREGDEIPEELFKAVAQVLAYVYRIKNRLTNQMDIESQVGIN